MTKLLTTDDVIRALGGGSALGRLVGRTPQSVNHWRGAERGKFPAWTFLIIQAALRERGLKAPATLWGVEEPSQRRSA
jgi:hypothetical protein